MTEGKTTSLSDYEGDVVVLNVWGQWCGPRRGEADDLEKVYEATKASGVEFPASTCATNHRPQHRISSSATSRTPIYDPPMRTLTALGGVPTSGHSDDHRARSTAPRGRSVPA